MAPASAALFGAHCKSTYSSIDGSVSHESLSADVPLAPFFPSSLRMVTAAACASQQAYMYVPLLACEELGPRNPSPYPKHHQFSRATANLFAPRG
ncbi:hypothetical protein ACN47E_001416 [Coniothyrium glycines]